MSSFDRPAVCFIMCVVYVTLNISGINKHTRGAVDTACIQKVSVGETKKKHNGQNLCAFLVMIASRSIGLPYGHWAIMLARCTLLRQLRIARCEKAARTGERVNGQRHATTGC